VINLFKATGSAFGLAMLCGSMACGCGDAANSVEHNKANFATQNQNNQTSAVSGDAFFALQDHKVVTTSTPAAVPARTRAQSSPAPSRDNSLNHWHLE
jgi:hypothetical protein